MDRDDRRITRLVRQTRQYRLVDLAAQTAPGREAKLIYHLPNSCHNIYSFPTGSKKYEKSTPTRRVRPFTRLFDSSAKNLDNEY